MAGKIKKVEINGKTFKMDSHESIMKTLYKLEGSAQAGRLEDKLADYVYEISGFLKAQVSHYYTDEDRWNGVTYVMMYFTGYEVMVTLEGIL